MAGSGTSGASGVAKVDDGSLKMPVMGSPTDYINPMYTRAAADASLSPLAAYQAYKRTGVMPQQLSGYQPFTAPNMQTVSVNTQTPSKPSVLGGLLGGLLMGNRGQNEDSANNSSNRTPMSNAFFRML